MDEHVPELTGYHLIVPEVGGGFRVFPLQPVRSVVGSDSACDIRLDEPTVSGQHAEFRRKPRGGYEVVDLESSNGTYVNDEHTLRAALFGGEQLAFGAVQAKLQNGFGPEAAEKERRLQDLDEQHAEAMQKMAQARMEELERAHEGRQRQEAALQQLQAEIQQAETKLEQAQADLIGLNALGTELQKKTGDFERLQAEVESTRVERNRLEREAQDCQRLLNDLTEKRFEREELVRSLDREVARKQGELSFLAERIEQARRERDAVLEELSVARSDLRMLGQGEEGLSQAGEQNAEEEESSA